MISKKVDRSFQTDTRAKPVRPGGSGWVSGGDGERESIEAGEAVAWDLGEEHESGSDEGMTAIVVEAEALDV